MKQNIPQALGVLGSFVTKNKLLVLKPSNVAWDDISNREIRIQKQYELVQFSAGLKENNPGPNRWVGPIGLIFQNKNKK